MQRRLQPTLLILLVLVGLVAFTHAGRAQVSPILINEVLVGNAGTNLDPDYTDFSGWIELLNTTGSAIKLTGYRLVSLPDGATAPQLYTIPRRVTIPANGRLLIWADEIGRTNHASFKLDMDGGELSLVDPGGTTLDQLALGKQTPDVSIGRSPDGGNWAFFDRPTPGTANTTPAFAAQDVAAQPQFSVAGGLHAGPLSVELSSPDVGAVIRYTTDGSRPTAASAVYSDPIAAGGITVLRARAWVAGKMVSPTATQTYLIDIPANLPIISLVTDPANLWDTQYGIYTKGNNGIANCGITANWHQSWERPASIEFYETDGMPRLNQEVGLEIFGNCTRNYARKSLEVKARKLYGDNDMDYAFFAGDKPMTSYKRLILRNAGQDNGNALLRDAMAQELVRDRMDVDRQAYRPAVVYLNGAYWGLYDMREKMDEDFVENTYGLNEDEFDMLEQSGLLVSGSKTAWLDFYSFVSKTNFTSPAAYAQMQARMDVNEFMNYLIPHMFGGFTSWPKRNTRFWDDHGDAFGWRWMLRDLDSTFEKKGITQNTIKQAAAGGPTASIYKQLLKNAAFRAEFAQRFAAHLNTTYEPARVIGIIDDMAAAIRPEMPAHIARWGQPASMTEWEAKVEYLRYFATVRPPNLRKHLRALVGNKPDAMLTINIDGDGRVLVAGAEVSDGYSGPHFRDVPITLTAVPGPGKLFDHWLETGETTPVIAIPFNGDTTRTAVFSGTPPPPPVVINEIHYNPPFPDDPTDDLYEFLELVNTGATAADLSSFTFTSGIVYTFPAGTTIAPGERIILAKTAATYSGNGYQVLQWTDGNLSNGGETLTLVDTFGQPVDSVTYDDIAPWPTAPDGNGPSLSLLDPTLDNADPANWAASDLVGGTPGAANFP